MENICEAGFTFIEAIAVAVIAAVLAAVAIPMYTGYIESQRRTVVKNLATTGAVAGNVYYRRHNQDPDSSSKLNIFLPDSSRYSVRILGNKIIVKDDLGDGDTVSASASFR